LERFTGQNWEQEDDITLVTVQRSSRRDPPPGETGTDAT
jgi:hypothetical protein